MNTFNMLVNKEWRTWKSQGTDFFPKKQTGTEQK